MTSSSETQPVGAVAPRYEVVDAGPTSGLGPRVEKILLVAEQEAAETRRSATREATGLIERARDEAEALRHEGEQAARAQRAEVDRVADRRAAELDERERRLEREREDVRSEGQRLLADAQHEADRLLSEAVGLAEAVRGEVDQEVAQRRADLDRELEDRRGEVERQMGWLEESRRAARDLAHMLLAQTGDGVPAERGEPAAAPWTDPEAAAQAVAAAAPEPATPEPDARPRPDVDTATEAVDEVPAAIVTPRHSAYATPPPELRFVGTFGDLSLLGSVDREPAEGPRSRAGDREPSTWFVESDSTERLRAVPGRELPGRTA